MLDADVAPGRPGRSSWCRFANRAATSDEQAREFVDRIRTEAALDDVIDLDE